MTLDKFGRHLLKHAKTRDESDNEESIDISEYMFYNHILRFVSEKTEGNKFILETGKTEYKFPLERSEIANVIVNIDSVSIIINNKIFTPNELSNFSLNKNDVISFVSNTHSKEKTIHLFAEIIIKCPIRFESSSVQSEKAYYKHKP